MKKWRVYGEYGATGNDVIQADVEAENEEDAKCMFVKVIKSVDPIIYENIGMNNVHILKEL